MFTCHFEWNFACLLSSLFALISGEWYHSSSQKAAARLSSYWCRFIFSYISNEGAGRLCLRKSAGAAAACIAWLLGFGKERPRQEILSLRQKRAKQYRVTLKWKQGMKLLTLSPLVKFTALIEYRRYCIPIIKFLFYIFSCRYCNIGDIYLLKTVKFPQCDGLQHFKVRLTFPGIFIAGDGIFPTKQERKYLMKYRIKPIIDEITWASTECYEMRNSKCWSEQWKKLSNIRKAMTLREKPTRAVEEQNARRMLCIGFSWKGVPKGEKFRRPLRLVCGRRSTAITPSYGISGKRREC